MISFILLLRGSLAKAHPRWGIRTLGFRCEDGCIVECRFVDGLPRRTSVAMDVLVLDVRVDAPLNRLIIAALVGNGIGIQVQIHDVRDGIEVGVDNGGAWRCRGTDLLPAYDLDTLVGVTARRRS